MPPQAGDLIGACRLEELVGEGAFGRVFRARAEGDAAIPKDTVVAVKVLHGLHASDAKIVGRFHGDARKAAALSHPHAAKIFRDGVDRGEHYVVMEFAEGRGLTEYLKESGIDPPETRSADRGDESAEAERPIRNLPIPEAVEIMRQVAGALQAAYEIGLVHRDIRPENIFISKDRTGRIAAKLVDFGLPKDLIARSRSLSSMARVAGAPPFMSPEQFKGKALDTRSDLYSLGATAYIMLTGRPPFPGPTLSAYARRHREDIPTPAARLNVNVPDNLSRVLDRLLAKKPKHRHQNPAELIEDLHRIERGEEPLKRYQPRKGRPQGFAFTLGIRIACAVLILGVAFGLWHQRSQRVKKNISKLVSQARRLADQGKLDDSLAHLKEVTARHGSARPEWLVDARKLRENVLQQITLREEARRKQAEREARTRAEKARTLEEKGDALFGSRAYAGALAAYRSAAGWAENDKLAKKIETTTRLKAQADEKAAAEQARKDAEQRRRRDAQEKRRRLPISIVVPDQKPTSNRACTGRPSH